MRDFTAAAIIVSLAACAPTRLQDLPDETSNDSGPMTSPDSGPLSPGDAGPMGCVNGCASNGALRCVGNGVESCNEDTNGCFAWSSAVDCGSSQFCMNGQCQSSCESECSNAGALQCAGDTVEQCSSSNGCLVWDQVSICATNQSCVNGQCLAMCTNACAGVGDTQCVGGSIQSCESAATGCLAWSMPAACGPGFTCRSGDCVSSCTNGCAVIGANECSGDGLTTCQQQADGCLAWGAVQSCGTGATCDSATSQCVTTTQTQTTIGAPCTDDTQCTAGTGPVCEPAANGFPGGYCLSTCATSTDCGASGSCVSGLFSNGSYCMDTCTTNSDCRSGYFCGVFGGLDFCYPMCQTNADCGTNETCDTTTGVCGETTGAYPAAFPPPPQVIDSGGPVLAAPYLVPVFFSNDDMSVVTELEGFYSQVGASSFWQATSEYGVGPATSATPIVLAESSASVVNDSLTTGSGLWTWLEGEITAHKLPTATANTIYVINYPAGTTIDIGSVQSCTGFGGYHSEMDLTNATPVTYAVIPRCAPPAGWTLLQYATGAASHELVEASTDPEPFTNPAYYNLDVAHYEWSATFNESELGDMCVLDPEAFYEFPDLPYVVQRFWSNASISAGHDPCVPETQSEVFFYSVAEMSDPVSYPAYNQTLQVTGVSVAVGQSKTIPVILYSDAATSGPWTVSVLDENQLNGNAADLSFALDASTGQNGTTLNLTITPMTAGPDNVDVFYILSTLGSGSSAISHYSIGVVGE